MIFDDLRKLEPGDAFDRDAAIKALFDEILALQDRVKALEKALEMELKNEL